MKTMFAALLFLSFLFVMLSRAIPGSSQPLGLRIGAELGSVGHAAQAAFVRSKF